MTTPDIKAAALRYAAAGWPVFPCKAGGKVPLFPSTHSGGDPLRGVCKGGCGRLGHGLYDATTDPSTISGWWAQHPEANVGIATGGEAPDVLDFDVKNGAPGRKTYERLRDAGLLRGAHATVGTPSGGFHLYYLGSAQGNAAMHRHGVDLRSLGGYVLAPPSVVDNKAYVLGECRTRFDGRARHVDMAAIRRLLDPPIVRHARPVTPGDHGALVRHVAGQGNGNRNNALHWAACRAAEGGAGDDVFDQLLDAALSIGLPSAEAQKTIDSARHRAGARA